MNHKILQILKFIIFLNPFWKPLLKELRSKPQTRRKYLQNIYLTKDLHSECTKKLLQLSNKMNTSNFKVGNDLNRPLTNEGIQMTENTKKVHPNSSLGKWKFTQNVKQ